jgi:hypothetical protein
LCHPRPLAHQRQRAGTPIAADSYAAAVYGSIVAAALVTALRETHASSGESVASLLSTMAVFWLAHVWSQVTGERIHHGTRFAPHLVYEIARAGWPLMEAAFGPTVVLLLGWARLVTDRTALTGALVVCALQLMTWAFVVGRRAYDHWYYAALSALGNGLLGLILVVLETIVLH